MKHYFNIDLNIINKITYIVLYILVFVSQIPQIYVFSCNEDIAFIIKILDLACYFIFLLIIILKYIKGMYFDIINNKKCLYFFLVVFLLVTIGYCFSRNTVLIKGFIMLFACKNLNFTKILKTLLYGFLSVLCFSLVLYLFRISDLGPARRGGLSLGFVHPNILAQFILLIDLLVISLYSYKLKINHLCYICFGTGLLEYFITKSRTTTLLILLIPFLFFITRYLLLKGKEIIIDRIGEWSYFGVLCITIITALLYPFSHISQILNKLVNSRIFLNYYILTTYPPTLFGQNVPLQNSTGEVYDAVSKVGNIHTTVDNSYMIGLIILGIIPMIITVILYNFTVRKLILNNNYTLIIVAIILCLYGFCEAQMLPFYNFFVYFYLLSSHNRYDELTRRRFYDT